MWLHCFIFLKNISEVPVVFVTTNTLKMSFFSIIRRFRTLSFRKLSSTQFTSYIANVSKGLVKSSSGVIVAKPWLWRKSPRKQMCDWEFFNISVLLVSAPIVLILDVTDYFVCQWFLDFVHWRFTRSFTQGRKTTAYYPHKSQQRSTKHWCSGLN